MVLNIANNSTDLNRFHTGIPENLCLYFTAPTYVGAQISDGRQWQWRPLQRPQWAQKKNAGLAFFDALFQLFTVLENFKKIPIMLEKNEFKSLKN